MDGSRGSVSVSATARKRFTLLWVALFVFSLLLQYTSFSAPSPVVAFHGGTQFELDRNAADGGAAGDDWENVWNDSDSAIAIDFVDSTTEKIGADVTYFKGGGSKDVNDISQWEYGATDVAPEKDEILDAFAAAYAVDGATYVYFGADRFDGSGDAQIGFWFFQNPVSLGAGGTFNGVHSVNDLLIISDFSNGGSVAEIKAYRWTGTGASNLAEEATGADCLTAVDPHGPGLCATVNDGSIATAWPFLNKAAQTEPAAGEFFEGGLDLGKVFPNGVPCFSSFLSETRSSTSPNAQLKDFTLGSFDTCGSLTIVKDAQPNDVQDFPYSSTGGLSPSAFDLDDDDNATLSNTRVFNGINPGTYTVTEGAVSGWDLFSISCDDGNSTGDVGTRTATIDIAPAEDVTCTFVNRKRGSITIVKDAQPNDAQDFAYSGGLGAFSLDDDGNPLNDLSNTTTFSNLVPGSYPVTETAAAGWDLTNLTCDDGDGGTTTSTTTRTATIDLDPGQDITCTFVNSKRGSIVIIKDAVPNDAQDFHYATTGTDLHAFDLDDDSDGTLSNTTTFSDVTAGTYTVTEDAISGWDLTNLVCIDPTGDSTTSLGTRKATIDLSYGETVTCTYTNTKRGHIIVDKVTDPAGDPQSFAFTTGGTGYAGFSLTDAAAPNDQELVPGTYSVAEAVPAGWDLTSAICSDGSAVDSIGLSAGETVTCTFTNTKRGSIIVEKQTSPDGATDDFTFSGDAAGAISDGEHIVVGNLVPRQYTSTEADPGVNWDLGAIECDDANSTGSVGTRAATFNLDPGETVTCVFTNVQRGTITIIKDAIPNDAQDFGFTTTGSGLSSFSLDDDADATLSNMRTFSSLVAGDYSVTESAVDGWDPTGLDCEVAGGSTALTAGATASLHLTTGGSITCVYENTKRGHIIVDKVTHPAADPTLFTFDPSWSETNFQLADGSTPHDSGPLVPGTYSVSEIVLAGWDLSGASCSDESPVTAISLQPGETVTCTFTNRNPQLTIVKSVVNNTVDRGTLALGGKPAVIARVGDTLRYTLTYTLTNGPVHNAVIDDVMQQAGLGTPSNISNGGTYSAATRTIHWSLGTLTTGGTLTYEITVIAGADELNQPFKNIATIDSDETSPSSDHANAAVEPTPLAATARPRVTLPPTDTSGSGPDQGATGNGMLMVLLVLAGLATVLGFLTPAPSRVRRRGRRG